MFERRLPRRSGSADDIGQMGHLPLIDSIIRRHNPIVKQFVNLPIINFTVDQIREHQKREEFRKHPDFVSQFTQAAEKYPEVMDEDRIAENARSAIAAGSDTTAVALRGLVYHALLRPRCYGESTKFRLIYCSCLMDLVQSG